MGEVEWADLIEDLEEVKEIRIETGNKEVLIRSKLTGSSGKAFQAAGVSVPPTVRITKRMVMVQVIPYRHWCLNSRSRSARSPQWLVTHCYCINYFLTTVEDRFNINRGVMKVSLSIDGIPGESS